MAAAAPASPPLAELAQSAEVHAATVIARWWRRVVQQRRFAVLRMRLREAESALPLTLLPLLAPREAALLKDPASAAPSIRFR